MSTYLDKILPATRATVAAARERVSTAELERLAAAYKPRGWARMTRIIQFILPEIVPTYRTRRVGI